MRIVQDDFQFLAELTQKTVEACLLPPGAHSAGCTNDLNFSAVKPGGGNMYPAIWIQDFTMNYSTGFISCDDGMAHLDLILRCQNGDTAIKLKNNALIPAHAIPDHINFDGTPVFFPGTYSSGMDQGGEPMGLRPPVNNHYDVIWLVKMLTQNYGEQLLSKIVGGETVYERLKKSFYSPGFDPETELIHCTSDNRVVGFIFCDAVYMTGYLLMGSLLRRRAALQMAELAKESGHHADHAEFLRIQEQITANIAPVFGASCGWLKASTGVSAQPDVWGTAFAIYSGAIKGEIKEKALSAITSSVKAGTVEFEGAFRHVPLDHDFSDDTAWEQALPKKNFYENGAYWHTPSGWVITALREDYPEISQQVWERYISHIRKYAFTNKAHQNGAPWECISRDGKANKKSIFGPSVSLPYSVLKKDIM